MGTNGEFHHVAVLGTDALMDLFEIAGHLADVVITDDAFDILEAADLVGDVRFAVDPVEAGDDRLAEQGLAIVLVAIPATAIDGAAHGGPHRARFAFHHPLEVGSFLEEVEAHFKETGAALAGLLNLDLHHLVPRPADDNAETFQGATVQLY